MPSLTVGLPNYGPYLGAHGWRTLLDLAVAAEEAGLHGVSVVDHVVMGSRVERYPYGRFPGGPEAPWLEPLTVLAAVAAVTERVELATAVLISPLRPAALLAKTAATVDVLSGGRLVLGVGTGWQEEEYRALGADWERRHQVFDDQLAACAALWTGGPVDLEAPTVGVWRKPAAARLVQRVHQLAEHVELELAERRIADPHRRRVLVARQPRHLPLG